MAELAISPEQRERLGSLRATLDEALEALNQRFLDEVDGATHLTDDQQLDRNYYVRHRIETIKRIQLTARTDALALAEMVREDYDAAREWARYACEELDHDSMFYEDLASIGIGRELVDATPLMQATAQLDAFLHEHVAEHGSLPAVAYSLFVEWNSERFSRLAVEKVGKTFGDVAVQGSRSHVVVDETENHYETMLWIAQRLTFGPGRQRLLYNLIDDVAALFRQYFNELARTTLQTAG